MKKTTLALILSIVASALCLGNFFYKWAQQGQLDYMILAAGLFILAMGYGVYARKAA